MYLPFRALELPKTPIIDFSNAITSFTVKSLRILPDDDFLIGILFWISLAPTHFTDEIFRRESF